MVNISLEKVSKFLEITSQLMLENVSCMFLLLLTHPSTDIAVLQLSTLYWQGSLSMENFLSKNTPDIPVSSLKLTLNLEDEVLQFLRSSWNIWSIVYLTHAS